MVLAFNNPKFLQGEIKAPLEKVAEKMEVVEDGKKAITSYEVLDNVGEKFCLVKAEPLTGRTHQIRAHMEYLGCPIVGDNKYYGSERKKAVNLSSKLHLHAYKIDLSAVYNKKLVVKASLPDYFVKDMSFLGLELREK